MPRDPDRLIEIVMELQDHNTHLQGIVATLTRALYGPRSEKLIADATQLPLELDDVVISETPLPANDDDGSLDRPSGSATTGLTASPCLMAI